MGSVGTSVAGLAVGSGAGVVSAAELGADVVAVSPPVLTLSILVAVPVSAPVPPTVSTPVPPAVSVAYTGPIR